MLHMDLRHVKMLNLDLKCMNGIFVCSTTTFIFVANDIQAWKSSILCFLTFKETLIDLEG